LVFCIGAFVFRLDNGWLSFPQISSTSNWEVLFSGLTTHLFMVGVSFGILTASAFKEKKKRDPYGFKRFTLTLGAIFFTWFAMYLDVSPYSDMGRDPNAHLKPIGIFDWLIGHPCEDFDFRRLWLHQSLGVTLYGLTVTAPFGMCLYYAGYSWEYLFSGVVISALYEIGFQISAYNLSGLNNGDSIGQALSGGWLCLVLFVNLVGKYKNIRNLSVPFLYGRNKFFGVWVTLIDLLYLGCIIGYSFANFKASLKYKQSLMALITLVTGLIVIQIGFIIYGFLKNRRSSQFNRSVKTTFDQVDTIAFAQAVQEGKYKINSDDQQEPGLCHLCSPYAKFPYNIISILLRVIILGWTLWFIILLLNTIVQDRIMAPCQVPWDI